MDSKGRARPLWRGCGGAGAPRAAPERCRLRPGLGERAAPRPVLVAPGSRPAKEAAPPRASRGGGGAGVGGRRGSLVADLQGHGHGVGVPHKHRVTEGAAGVVTRKEPTGTGSFLHFRKLSRATLRMSWNGDASPARGGQCGVWGGAAVEGSSLRDGGGSSRQPGSPGWARRRVRSGPAGQLCWVQRPGEQAQDTRA